jgi:hypothetical protein
LKNISFWYLEACILQKIQNRALFVFKMLLNFHPISSKSGMRLEVLMENKINEKFVLKNEGSLGIISAIFRTGIYWSVKAKKQREDNDNSRRKARKLHYLFASSYKHDRRTSNNTKRI